MVLFINKSSLQGKRWTKKEELQILRTIIRLDYRIKVWTTGNLIRNKINESDLDCDSDGLTYACVLTFVAMNFTVKQTPDSMQ